MDGVTYAGEGSLPPVADTNWNILRVTDTNGDGDGDLFWHNAITNETCIWYMSGTTLMDIAELNLTVGDNWLLFDCE